VGQEGNAHGKAHREILSWVWSWDQSEMLRQKLSRRKGVTATTTKAGDITTAPSGGE